MTGGPIEIGRLKYHPDKITDRQPTDEDERPECFEPFKAALRLDKQRSFGEDYKFYERITKAYDVLSTKEARSKAIIYDCFAYAF